MTNDGSLTYKVLHPKFNILKTYEIILNSELREDDIKKIKKGVIIDGAMFEVQDMQFFFENDKKVKITIHEGRKRIIRRVFKSLGYEVVDLKRIRIGNYEIKDMQEGTYKELKQSDVRKILMIDD